MRAFVGYFLHPQGWWYKTRTSTGLLNLYRMYRYYGREAGWGVIGTARRWNEGRRIEMKDWRG